MSDELDQQQYDNFICGQCCAEFYTLPSFLAHKKTCNSEWPVVIPSEGSVESTVSNGTLFGSCQQSEQSAQVMNWQLTGEPHTYQGQRIIGCGFQAEDQVTSGGLPVNAGPAIHCTELSRESGISGSDYLLTVGSAPVSLIQIQSTLVALQQQQMQQMQLIHQMYQQLLGEKPSTVGGSGFCPLPANLDSSKRSYLSFPGKQLCSTAGSVMSTVNQYQQTADGGEQASCVGPLYSSPSSLSLCFHLTSYGVNFLGRHQGNHGAKEVNPSCSQQTQTKRGGTEAATEVLCNNDRKIRDRRIRLYQATGRLTADEQNMDARAQYVALERERGRLLRQKCTQEQSGHPRPRSCPQPVSEGRVSSNRLEVSLPSSPFDQSSISQDSAGQNSRPRSESQTAVPLMFTDSFGSALCANETTPVDLSIPPANVNWFFLDALQSTSQLFCHFSSQKSHGPLYSASTGTYECFPSGVSNYDAAAAAAAAAAAMATAAENTLLTSVIGNEVDDDWESMMEITASDEAEKIRKLVGEGCTKVTDPNQCVICKRVLSLVDDCFFINYVYPCCSALQMHYRTHTGERPFKCKICQRAFTTKGNLKTHMGVHRTKPAFRIFHQCPECHKKFTNAVVLQQHLRSHGPRAVQLFSDKLLATADFPSTASLFQNPSNDIVHSVLPTTISSSTAGTTSSTPMTPIFVRESNCGDVLSSSPIAPDKAPIDTSAMRFVGQEQMVFSDVAPAFSNLCFLPVDNSPVPSGQSPTRLGAGSLILPPGAVTPTMLISSQASPFVGSLMSSSDASAAATMVTFSGRPNTTCNICFKCFACQSALEIHYRSHTKERPFKCHICSRGFSTKGNMKQHLLTHKVRQLPIGDNGLREDAQSSADNDVDKGGTSAVINDDRFTVKAPSSTQGRNDSQNDRLTNGDQNDPSPLESIQRMWSQAETLATSNVTTAPVMKKSNAFSKHQCQLCCKHFSSASALQIHMRTHTGDKPFKCTVCERAFTTKGNLKVHMGTHMWATGSGHRGRRLFDASLSPLSNIVGSTALGSAPVDELVGSARESHSVGMPYESSAGSSSDEIRKETSVRRTPSTPSECNFSYDRTNSVEESKSQEQNLNESPPPNKVPFSGYQPLPGSSILPMITATGFQLNPPPAGSLAFVPAVTEKPSVFQADCSTSPSSTMPTTHSATHDASNDSEAMANGHGDSQSVGADAMLRLWHHVCYICHKTCRNGADLEEHIKAHLMQNSLERSDVVHVD
ncbi:spalt protein [Trichuris trichiura]|uniref:Spalt protein n=1 Tax=Trichuris trichiura TaxID=36087 RepID=A0A077YVJ3_TRITR|nr:spalt protein [Trichuris trichiura]